VDTHTAGEPTRIILFGYPIIKGKSIVEKIGTYKQEFDDLRKILLLEPRGHKDMVGAALIHPTETEADFGVIFMDSKGYQDMCGHGSIGIATAAIELGLVRTQEPITKVKLETLAGLINCAVRVREGKADEVSLENVPSFVYESNIKLDVPKIGKITIDISFGGNFFAQVESSQLKTELEMQNISRIIDRALAIRKECNRRVRVEHPELEHIKGIHQIQIYSKIGESPKTYKNIVVFGEGQVDRSPCGTGTSALMSLLYYKKELKIQEEIMNKSILDTMFRGKLLRLHRVKEFEAMVPQVTGSAYITGFHQFVVDPRDPLKNGFLL
jgi:proline racemase/trans-L-3-hydroxyproline dehydratase